MKKSLLLTAALLVASPAYSQDYCLSMPFSPVNTTLVGRNFGALPVAPRSCKAWTGYSPTTNGEGGASTGTACRTSDSKRIKFTIISSYSDEVDIDSIEMTLATSQGFDTQTRSKTGQGVLTASTQANGAKCVGGTLN